MLRFLVFDNGRPAEHLDLSNAYLFGCDTVPLRAEIKFSGGVLTCTKRNAGPAGLALLWPVDSVGQVLLETVRLQERDQPFVLPLELARGQLMRMHHKSEDWGLFDCPDIENLNSDMDSARRLLVDALKAEQPADAAQTADRVLALATTTAERMAAYHADILLERRKLTAGFTRRVFGCQVDLTASPGTCAPWLTDAFDFATLPIRWRQIEPQERSYDWTALDKWVDWLAKHRIPIKGSPLACFRKECVPDWLHIWEHDFETIRELVTGHIRRVINRYGKLIQVWDVISGIHANQTFSFNFEQLIELTRVAAGVTKQMAPRSLAIIDLVAPWGEYYAHNQRTIPPILYAEMAIQSGISFDAFGLQFCFGPQTDGMYARDMFQISSLLDRFGALAKPLHLTAVQVPSRQTESGGIWHDPWSETVQSQWLRQFYRIALSKPFVETVSWRTLSDTSGQTPNHAGLLRADLTPKPAYNELVSLREETLPHEPSN